MTTNDKPIDPDDLLCYGATSGKKDLCELAREHGATHFDGAIECAAANKQFEICKLLLEWYPAGQELMFMTAAAHNDPTICALAREKGARNLNAAIASAAANGYAQLCQTLLEWSVEMHARVWLSNVFIEGAKHSQISICELARDWMIKSSRAPYSFTSMLCAAASSGHTKICELAREWTQKYNPSETWTAYFKVNKMLTCGAREGFAEICELAKKWGALKFDKMFVSAARGGHCALCELARDWAAQSEMGPLGPRDYARAYETARTFAHTFAMILDPVRPCPPETPHVFANMATKLLGAEESKDISRRYTEVVNLIDKWRAHS